MAKKIYVPVSNLSDEVKKIIVPVGGVSKYAVKGYCSVNGLSKKFWGASQPSPEYDYEAGETYTIHNSLTMVETLDEAFNKFDAEMIRRNIYSFPSSYPGPNYLKNNWNTIRTAIINKLGTVTATCIFIRINTASSDKEVSFNIYFGGDSFPRQVTIQQVSTGTLDTKYCLFTSGTYLNTTYFMSASVKQNNTYTVSDPAPYSNFLSGMGCWSNYVGSASQGACSSYGMKMD